MEEENEVDGLCLFEHLFTKPVAPMQADLF